MDFLKSTSSNPASSNYSRGQSAVEYVTTYGWALLFLVLVIGALLASGIADPSYIISEGCNLGPTMQCNFQVYSTGDISTGGTTVIAFNVSNGFGYNVSIKSFLVSLESDDAIFAELVDSGSPFVVPSGESFSDKAELGFSASPGSLQKFNVHVEYVSCAKEINPECKVDDSFKPHTVTGKIVGRVLKGQ
ncbi:TPA: hypothetical protein HA238_02055 [Candidatus Micrarchaeota archaeon]|nr:hypothetical protein [Candidatus Micrarchaeota archaeon]